jgi:hypothetical protein
VTSLPKRGDRVRVTWAHQHSSLKVGSEVVLSSHGYAVDPANELYRPTPPPDCVSFMYADGHRERGSHAVKVEILERAGASKVEIIERDGYKFTLTCRKCGLAMMLEAGPLQRADTTIDTCALCDEKSAEFARGMRRAVEIAEGLGFGAYGNRSIAYVDELKEAVEKETADG